MLEKRAHSRVPFDVQVTCEIPGFQPFQGTCRDISVGGMFIECEFAIEFGTELTILCPLPSGEARLPAIARWGKPGGFGVQFGLLGARDTHAITELLRKS